jgi:hypothetical protein
MQNIVQPGEQPRRCVIDICSAPQVRGEVYCRAHLEWFARQNGTATTPPVTEPDDPDLLEREAKRARAQEEEEYRERRRVKTWKTLDNGSRVPDEYYSDDELGAIEAQAAADLVEMERRLAATGPPVDDIAQIYEPLRQWQMRPSVALDQPDPVKEATKIFKAALKGKLGDLAKEHAWLTVRLLADMR